MSRSTADLTGLITTTASTVAFLNSIVAGVGRLLDWHIVRHADG